MRDILFGGGWLGGIFFDRTTKSVFFFFFCVYVSITFCSFGWAKLAHMSEQGRHGGYW